MEQPGNTSNPQQNQPFQQYHQQFNQGGGYMNVPNSVAVLVLGILSIVFCWCYGILSIILGIIALVLASAGEREYRMNPHLYSLASYKNLKAGKTCAILGLCLAGVAILCAIIYVVLVGSLAFNFLNVAFEN